MVFFVLAIWGSQYLIMDAIEEYQFNSVSMVVESLRPYDQTEFVSVALCEMGHTKQSYKNLDDIMKQLRATTDNMAIISLIPKCIVNINRVTKKKSFCYF